MNLNLTMKSLLRTLCLLLLCLCLSACSANHKEEEEENLSEGTQIVEVKITGANFYDYFDYREYPDFATDEDGNINACNLSYTGTAWSEEREQVSETLDFWPQGNRTVSYPYGTLSSSYIIRLYNFTVTAVSGSIFLLIG